MDIFTYAMCRAAEQRRRQVVSQLGKMTAGEKANSVLLFGHVLELLSHEEDHLRQRILRARAMIQRLGEPQ